MLRFEGVNTFYGKSHILHDAALDVREGEIVAVLNRALQVVFATLTILFFMLAIGDFTDASPGFRQLTGYEGIFCGFSAIYAGLAQVLNELFGKTVLPLGIVTK